MYIVFNLRSTLKLLLDSQHTHSGKVNARWENPLRRISAPWIRKGIFSRTRAYTTNITKHRGL